MGSVRTPRERERLGGDCEHAGIGIFFEGKKSIIRLVA